MNKSVLPLPLVVLLAACDKPAPVVVTPPPPPPPPVVVTPAPDAGAVLPAAADKATADKAADAAKDSANAAKGSAMDAQTRRTGDRRREGREEISRTPQEKRKAGLEATFWLSAVHRLTVRADALRWRYSRSR
jgi:hypothetical protein